MLKAGSVNEHFIGLITFKYKGFNFNLCCKMPKGVRYGRWNPEDLERPLETVRNVDVDLNAASPEDPVPKNCLERSLTWKELRVFCNTRQKMSQKAVERTYISALEEARKSWDLQLILEI
jgi:hypothetical protein